MSAFDPSIAPFTSALVLMGLIALAEVIGAIFGIMPSAMLDNALPDFDTDIDIDLDTEFESGVGSPLDGDVPDATVGPTTGPFTAILNWLCIGRVPILVLIVAFLSAFGITGWLVQGFATETIGTPLPISMALLPAIAAAVPSTRWLGLAIAKVLPKEQTEALSSAGFVGKVATVVSGTARRGLPAEAKLTDSFGQVHYVRVEPDEDDEFEQGTEVLLVSRAGGVFKGVRNTNPALSPT
ncbi:YqiJ family protein [Pyruvatibacter sp.]|uniref:YqiJ family protein n=1 Tax=Pyruvatibacter sp. TaxID=1981328 RepID=UPI0032648A4C